MELQSGASAAANAEAPADPPSVGRLALIGLTKRFHGRAVLDDVSIAVSGGEVVALFGPDGAGKSVCFEAVAGLIKTDGGRILIDGIDVTHLPTYRRAILGLAYLPEGESVFRGLTVAENIDAILEVWEPDRAARSEQLERILAEFRLSEFRDRSAMKLSGGERRRCEIARAMATSPSILILDEPFAGIDPLSIEDIKHVINQLKRSGVGILITDYDLRDTLDVMDRGYVLYRGKVIFSGNSAELLADEEVRSLYLGSAAEIAGSAER